MASRIVDLTLPLSCTDLLPHRAPMLLAGELLEREPGQARLRAVVGADNPFVDGAGRLDGAAVIELAAQATAALKGYEARLRGEPVKIGYLAGIRDFELGADARVGDELELAVSVEFAMEQAALVQGEVRRAGEVIGAGTIKIWEEKAWPSLPERKAASDVNRDARLKAAGGGAGGDARAPGMDPFGRALAGALTEIEPGGGETQVVGAFEFGDDFPGFRGHFPGFPILPAVLMPRMGLLLAETKTGRRLRLRRVEQAKIGQGVFPGDRVRVEATLDPHEGGAVRVKMKLAGPRGAATSFTLGCEMTDGQGMDFKFEI